MIQNTLVITAEIRIHLAFNYNSRRLYTTHSLKLFNIYLHKDLEDFMIPDKPEYSTHDPEKGPA